MPKISAGEWNYPDGSRIICSDCLPVLRDMPVRSIDTIITDPPYNNGTRYASYDDSMDSEDYASWCSDWFGECRRIAGRVIIFPGPWKLDLWLRLGRPGGIGCWHKPGTAAGHQSSNAFQYVEWEPFLVYGGRRMGGSNVITARIGKKNPILTGSHPCPKPLRLMMELVRKVKGDSILDPFMGSGTTGVAAVLSGKVFTGIELDERYAKEAAFRIERVLNRIASQGKPKDASNFR